MRLKEAAGWNQTAADWELVMRMAPAGCFGLECEGLLAATTTAVAYGCALGWIGMVLTAPEFRGRGFARQLMLHALETLDQAGVELVKLDATDMGYPLYRSLGFEDECTVERRLREPGPAAAPEAALASFEIADWLSLDCKAFGANRAGLLASLAAVESIALPGGGFAMTRPGAKAAYIGPVVAHDGEAAGALIAALVARRPEQPLFIDVLSSNPAAVQLAEGFGFAPRRRLVRMARRRTSTTQISGAGAARFLHNDSYVFALAGFEYG